MWEWEKNKQNASALKLILKVIEVKEPGNFSVNILEFLFRKKFIISFKIYTMITGTSSLISDQGLHSGTHTFIYIYLNET